EGLSGSMSGVRGPSWQVMAGVEENVTSQCYRANSVEVVFGLDSRAYLDFIDELLDAGSGYQQAGYVSLRFSRKTSALLSMHNVDSPMAASIEVASLAGLPDNDIWLEFVERRAVELGGRPHWGQQNRLTGSQVSSLYGADKLNEWREQLLRITGHSQTFSNDYTRRRGLEPTGLRRHVTAVRRSGGRVTHLCNEGAHWSPLPVELAARHITSGEYTYMVDPADDSVADRLIVVRRILST